MSDPLLDLKESFDADFSDDEFNSFFHLKALSFPNRTWFFQCFSDPF